MLLYRTSSGSFIQNAGTWHAVPLTDWDSLFDSPNLAIYLAQIAATTPAVMRLHTFHTDPDALQRLDLSCNGRKLECTAIPVPTGGKLAQVVFRAQVTLRADAPSVLEFRLDAGQAPAPGRRGIGIGNIRLWLRKAKPVGRA